MVYDPRTRNRGVGRDGLGALKSGRIGSIGGRPTRTFHCHFRGITAAQKSAHGAVDYLAREGDFERKHHDLVEVIGDIDQVKEAITLVDADVRIRNGKTAERVAIATVFELPGELSRDAQVDVATRIVTHWRGRGHPAVAAIHDDGQPHIHVVATARPVDYGVVDRSPTAAPLRGKAATRLERQLIAQLINEVASDHGIAAVDFHGGRLADTGIARQAKKRVPERQYHAQGQRERDLRAVAARKAEIQSIAQAAAEKRLQAAQRRQERLAEAGLVSVEALTHARDRAAELVKRGKAFAAASARQKELIRTMAGEAGVEVTDLQLAQLDGGDLMAAVKAAKRQGEAAFRARVADAEKRVQDLERQNVLLTAALERERQKAAQAMRKARPEAKSVDQPQEVQPKEVKVIVPMVSSPRSRGPSRG